MRSLHFCAIPPHQQSLLVARDQPVAHAQDVVDAAVVRALVPPVGGNWPPQVHHAQLAVTGPVAGHVLVDHAQGLHLLTQRAAGHRPVGPWVGETEIGGIGHGHQGLPHAFQTVDIAALHALPCHLARGEVVGDDLVVAAGDESGTFLHEVDGHDLAALAETGVLAEEERDDVVSDEVLADLEQLDLEVDAQSDHAEAAGRGTVLEQLEDVPLVQLLGDLEGVLAAEGTLARIPETDTALQVADQQVLVDHGQPVRPLGQHGGHHLKLLLQVVDLDPPPRRLLALAVSEVVAADELLLVEDGQLLHLDRGVLVGEVHEALQLARVEGRRLHCLWLKRRLQVDLAPLLLLPEAGDVVSRLLVETHHARLHLAQLSLVELGQLPRRTLALRPARGQQLPLPPLRSTVEGLELRHVLDDLPEVRLRCHLEHVGRVSHRDRLVHHPRSIGSRRARTRRLRLHF